MAIEFECPHCSKALRCSEKQAGRAVKCPQCNEVLTIPETGTTAPDEEPEIPIPDAPSDSHVDEYDNEFELDDEGEADSEEFGFSDEFATEFSGPSLPDRSRRSGNTSEKPSGSYIRDLLSFRRMITPFVIQVAFWIGVVGMLIMGVISIGIGFIAVFQDQAGPGVIAIVSGLAYCVLGPLVIRIYAEIIILFFRMNETLTDIRDRVS